MSDLARLSEFDVVIHVDGSGSMNTPSNKFAGKSRWQEVQEMAIGIAGIAEKIDDDGITVVVFSGSISLFDGCKSSKVAEIFAEKSPWGSTNLAGSLRAGLDARKDKKQLHIVFTDGAPDSELDVINLICEQAKRNTSDDDCTFGFIQVGDDEGATRFLNLLDDGLQAKYGLPYDIVDVVTREEAESMDPAALLAKLIND